VSGGGWGGGEILLRKWPSANVTIERVFNAPRPPQCFKAWTESEHWSIVRSAATSRAPCLKTSCAPAARIESTCYGPDGDHWSQVSIANSPAGATRDGRSWADAHGNPTRPEDCPDLTFEEQGAKPKLRLPQTGPSNRVTARDANNSG